MGSVVVSLLPLILGSTLVPIQVIINILLLQNPQQGALKSAAYIAGMLLLRALQGVLFLAIFTRSTIDPINPESGKGPVVLTLLLVLGILLLIAAYKKWKKEADIDDPPPKWLTAIESLSALKAFGLGFGIIAVGPKFWVFTLSAVGTISEARLGIGNSVIVYAIFVLLAQTTVLLPLILRLILPTRSRSLLQSFSNWLTRNERTIVVIVSLVFGLYFLYQGISGLLL